MEEVCFDDDRGDDASLCLSFVVGRSMINGVLDEKIQFCGLPLKF